MPHWVYLSGLLLGPAIQSTAPSHSLAANYQRVLALMKYHNPVICGAAAANIVAGRGRSSRKADKKRGRWSQLPPCGATEEEVRGLLAVLEEEFGRMTLWVWEDIIFFSFSWSIADVILRRVLTISLSFKCSSWNNLMPVATKLLYGNSKDLEHVKNTCFYWLHAVSYSAECIWDPFDSSTFNKTAFCLRKEQGALAIWKRRTAVISLPKTVLVHAFDVFWSKC